MDQNFAEAQHLNRLWVYKASDAVQGYIVAYRLEQTDEMILQFWSCLRQPT